REVRGDGDELRALEREDPVELRKANVVADGQPDRPALPPDYDRLGARLLGLGLTVDDAADLDVEQVDLAVEPEQLAVRPEGERGVRELLAALALLGDRAADERDPV